MGLKFCNEAIMCLAQLWPPHSAAEATQNEANTPLQEALIKRLGPNSHAFTMELTPLSPPSVQLVPAKEYHGAPIGTSYDVRAYVADRADEKLQRRTTVRMGIRVLQGSTKGVRVALTSSSTKPHAKPAAGSQRVHFFGSLARVCSQLSHDDSDDDDFVDKKVEPTKESKNTRLSPKSPRKQRDRRVVAATELSTSPLPEETSNDVDTALDQDGQKGEVEGGSEEGQPPPPHVIVDKPFLLSDGRVELDASLDKAVYSHGEVINVNVFIKNISQKTVRRIKVLIIQHVDVCMFSNGKFKNIVAIANSGDECPVGPGHDLKTTYTLQPQRGVTKNWIALEDSYSKSGASLASSVVCQSNSPEDRNVFAIYVSYYVKVKITLSAMGGELSVKLPFTLIHSCTPVPDGLTGDYSPKRLIDNQAMSVEADDIEIDDNKISEKIHDVLLSDDVKEAIRQSLADCKNDSSYKPYKSRSPDNEPVNGLTNVVINIEKENTKNDNDTVKEKERDRNENGNKKEAIQRSDATHRLEEDMDVILNYDSDDT